MVFSPIGPSIAPDSTPELSHLLLFDSDPQALAVLGSRFGKSGFRVLAAGDLARVRELARTATVSVLLVAVRADRPDSLALLREATRLPRRHPLICLAFGRATLRDAALAAGALAFLPVPIFINDVVSASRLLSGGAGVVRSGQAQIEVSLPLEHLGSIYHLIRVFTVLGRSAVVEATRDHATAELRFIDGALTSVDVPPWQGLAALHQILLWEDAALQVKFTKVGRRGRQLSLKPSEVLGECERFLRDFAHGVAGLGDARTIFAPNAARRPAPEMPSEVIPVLRQFDGQHDLAQILADSPFGIFDTLRIVKRFVGDDAIVPMAMAPSAGGGLSAQPVREPRRATARLDGPAALDVWFRRPSVDTAAVEAKHGGDARAEAKSESEAKAEAKSESNVGPGAGASGGRGATGNTNGAPPAKATEGLFSTDVTARTGTPTSVTATVSPAVPSTANPAVHGVQARDNPAGSPKVLSGGAVAPEGPPNGSSNPVPRRRTPHSMVATGELRIPGNTPPQPRAAVATLRLVPGVIVDLEGEAPPGPVDSDHLSGAPNLSSADVLTPPPRPPLGSLLPATVTATASARAPETRRQAGVVAQGEIRVARPRGGEAPSQERRQVPTILLDLPSVVVMHQPRPDTPGSRVAPPAEPAREELPGRPTPPLPATAESAPAPPVHQPAQAGRAAPRPHAHANPFSDVESDFFNREADLYEPSTVESFDDLDGTPGRTRNGSGPRRG